MRARPGPPAPAGPDRPTGPSRRRLRVLALSALGVFVAAHLILLSPTSDHPACSRTVRLTAQLAYPLSCDSRLLMSMAHQPTQILEPGNVRQSRPGYIAIGAASLSILAPTLKLLGVKRAYGHGDPAYFALILINYVAVVLAVAILTWLLLGAGAPQFLVMTLCTFLAINGLTRDFFWTPHQQIFTLLTPIATVVLTRRILTRQPSWRYVAGTGLLLGACALVYANVLITVAATAAALIVIAVRRSATGGLASHLGRCGGRIALLGAAFAALPMAWVTICQAVAGSYYNNEATGYHQFVWLLESAREGPHLLATRVVSAARSTGLEIVLAAGPALAVLGLAIVVALLSGAFRARARSGDRERHLLAAAFITVGCTALFLFALGFFRTRLGFHMLPPVLLLTGLVLIRVMASRPRLVHSTNVSLAVLLVLWVGHEITEIGP